jgi:hypothetical protein
MDNLFISLIKSLIVLALAAKLCMPGVAWAYLTGGTWIETGAENGSVPFTKIEVFADASTTLTDIVLYGLSAAGWTNTLVNPQYSVAQGPYTGSVTFTWQFPDPGDQYREIEYLEWNGTTLNSQQHLAFNQSGWYVPNGTGSWDIIKATEIMISSRILYLPVPPSPCPPPCYSCAQDCWGC